MDHVRYRCPTAGRFSMEDTHCTSGGPRSTHAYRARIHSGKVIRILAYAHTCRHMWVYVLRAPYHAFLACQIYLSFFFILYSLFFSPRWLISRERYKEALSILANLRSNGDTTDNDVLMEYTSIVQDVTFDRTFTSKKIEALFKKGIENYRKRTLLGAGIHTFAQLTGINALL
jgi:hypothetical protein